MADETSKDKDSKIKETIEVEKSEFSAILERLASLEKDNSMLKEVADKGRVDWYQKAREEKAPVSYRLSTYNGKVILAWRTVKDVMDKNPLTGVWTEHQEYEVIDEEGKSHKIVGYNRFSDLRYTNQIVVKEVSRAVTDENTTLKVKTEDGRTYDIDIRFVN